MWKDQPAKMLRHRHAMDAILKEMFANGGPMKASYRSGRRSAPVRPSNPKGGSECPALLAEQRRLIRTWGKP